MNTWESDYVRRLSETMRPRTLSPSDVRSVFSALRVSRQPVSAATFAVEAGVSIRTAHRYFRRVKARSVKCPTCRGAGVVRRRP